MKQAIEVIKEEQLFNGEALSEAEVGFNENDYNESDRDMKQAICRR